MLILRKLFIVHFFLFQTICEINKWIVIINISRQHIASEQSQILSKRDVRPDIRDECNE